MVTDAGGLTEGSAGGFTDKLADRGAILVFTCDGP